MHDALERTQPDPMPVLILTWNADAPELGQCKRIAGEPVIYLHLGRIGEVAESPERMRSLTAAVLAHELGHARLTCTDRDHAFLVPNARRARVESSTLTRRYAWDEGVPRTSVSAAPAGPDTRSR